METTRIVTNEYGTADIWRATDLEFLDFWERATRLGELYKTWQSMRRPDASPPTTDDFGPSILMAVLGAEVPAVTECAPHRLPDLFYAEAPPEAPMAFRLTAPGTAVRDRVLDGLFSPILCDALTSDLMLCQGLRQPLYQQIYQKVSEFERCYVRLLLPTVDACDAVQRIYGVSRPLYAEQDLMHWNAE